MQRVAGVAHRIALQRIAYHGHNTIARKMHPSKPLSISRNVNGNGTTTAVHCRSLLTGMYICAGYSVHVQMQAQKNGDMEPVFEIAVKQSWMLCRK